MPRGGRRPGAGRKNGGVAVKSLRDTKRIKAKHKERLPLDMMMQAADEVHGEPGVFQRPNEFPHATHSEFPLAAEATRYFTSGPVRQDADTDCVSRQMGGALFLPEG